MDAEGKGERRNGPAEMSLAPALVLATAMAYAHAGNSRAEVR